MLSYELFLEKYQNYKSDFIEVEKTDKNRIFIINLIGLNSKSFKIWFKQSGEVEIDYYKNDGYVPAINIKQRLDNEDEIFLKLLGISFYIVTEPFTATGIKHDVLEIHYCFNNINIGIVLKGYGYPIMQHNIQFEAEELNNLLDSVGKFVDTHCNEYADTYYMPANLLPVR